MVVSLYCVASSEVSLQSEVHMLKNDNCASYECPQNFVNSNPKFVKAKFIYL